MQARTSNVSAPPHFLSSPPPPPPHVPGPTARRFVLPAATPMACVGNQGAQLHLECIASDDQTAQWPRSIAGDGKCAQRSEGTHSWRIALNRPFRHESFSSSTLSDVICTRCSEGGEPGQENCLGSKTCPHRRTHARTRARTHTLTRRARRQRGTTAKYLEVRPVLVHVVGLARQDRRVRRGRAKAGRGARAADLGFDSPFEVVGGPGARFLLEHANVTRRARRRHAQITRAQRHHARRSPGEPSP